jgi:hypothetical protein
VLGCSLLSARWTCHLVIQAMVDDFQGRTPMCGTIDLDSLVFERSLTPRIQLPIFELVVGECALRQISRSASTGEQADQEERFRGGRNVVN